MKSEFGEAQFQFAILFELLNKKLWSKKIYIPTPAKENDEGFDAKLINKASGKPLFLQFKVSQHITDARGKHFGKFGKSYFKFHTYPWENKEKNQHNVLRKLNEIFPCVFYVAPLFCSMEDFQYFFEEKQLLWKSKFIMPKDLNEITDISEHEICYFENDKKVHMFSEERIVEEGSICFEEIEKLLRNTQKMTFSDFVMQLIEKLEINNKNIETLQKSCDYLFEYLNSAGVSLVWIFDFDK